MGFPTLHRDRLPGDRERGSVGQPEIARLVRTTPMRLAFVLAVLVVAAGPGWGYYDAGSGKPASKPLPTYCQMGECSVQTVEAIDPVLFRADAVLFRVESQNWQGDFNQKHLRRVADTTSYVLCSKIRPATIDQTSSRAYMVTFLTPNDGDTYGHFNETAMALYFTVCHARAFGDHLSEDGPPFAGSLGYTVQPREDQPTVDTLDKVMDFAR